MQRPKYPTDLTHKQWQRIKGLLPPAKTGGRRRTTNLREVLNALLSVTKTGIQWRMLPHDFPPHNTVYGYFWQWRNAGVWQRIHDTLRAQVRQQAGRHKHPTAGCFDAQSVKTTQVPGVRGFDAGKLVNGRKRPVLVDTRSTALGCHGDSRQRPGPRRGAAGAQTTPWGLQEAAQNLGGWRLPW